MKLEIPENLKSIEIYLWPAIGGLVTIILVALIIIPQFYKILETDLKIKQTQEKAAQLNGKANTLKQVQLESLKKDYSNVLYALPAQKDIPSTVSHIQYIANQSELEIEGVSVGLNPGTTGELSSFSVQVDVFGTTQDIENFLTSLKNTSRVMTVEDINLAGTRNPSQFSASLKINSYYKLQDNRLGALDTPVTILSEKDKEILSKLQTSLLDTPKFSQTPPSGEIGKSNPFE